MHLTVTRQARASMTALVKGETINVNISILFNQGQAKAMDKGTICSI